MEIVRDRVKPKELRLPPGDTPTKLGLISDMAFELLERALILRWMRQWLKWVHWYCTVALDPCTSRPLRLSSRRNLMEASKLRSFVGPFRVDMEDL